MYSVLASTHSALNRVSVLSLQLGRMRGCQSYHQLQLAAMMDGPARMSLPYSQTLHHQPQMPSPMQPYTPQRYSKHPRSTSLRPLSPHRSSSSPHRSFLLPLSLRHLHPPHGHPRCSSPCALRLLARWSTRLCYAHATGMRNDPPRYMHIACLSHAAILRERSTRSRERCRFSRVHRPLS